ncbi:MAG TPA: hypothetical protein DD412_01520 [Holosporales bacterium]|nr:hypothetical protein [Holosporales bacterium]
MLKQWGVILPFFSKHSIAVCLAFVFSTELYSTQYQNVEIHSAEQVHTFSLETADTPTKREKGLMYRQSLKDHEGMLFLFDQPERLCFWMKNTFISLDILLLNKQGVIVEILENMEPHSQKHRCSKTSMQRAIELKAGICHDKGIKVGDTLTLLGNTSLEKSE